MPPTKPPRETPNALQAYLDYEAMGDTRSLPKLQAMYRSQSEQGQAVPTTRWGTLSVWSSQHRWQERLKAQEEHEAELVREETRKRAAALRKRLMTAIEADMSLYAQKVGRGEAVLAEDAASLERMTKLYFQLAGDPLAEKVQQEHTGRDGNAIQVDTNGDALTTLASAIAGIAARRGQGSSSGESDK